MVDLKKTKRKRTSLRQRRTFSLAVKKKVVKDIENGRCSVLEASRELGVSDRSIYNWLNIYSRYLKSSKELVVQDKSESYRSKELEKKIMELEAMIGRQHLENELLNKLIELAGQEYGSDLKKSFLKKALNGSVSTKASSTGSK